MSIFITGIIIGLILHYLPRYLRWRRNVRLGLTSDQYLQREARRKERRARLEAARKARAEQPATAVGVEVDANWRRVRELELEVYGFCWHSPEGRCYGEGGLFELIARSDFEAETKAAADAIVRAEMRPKEAKPETSYTSYSYRRPVTNLNEHGEVVGSSTELVTMTEPHQPYCGKIAEALREAGVPPIPADRLLKWSYQEDRRGDAWLVLLLFDDGSTLRITRVGPGEWRTVATGKIDA